MFACEHEDVTPDILCLGKGLTGGYLPIAATLATGEIYQAFLGDYEDQKTFFHGHTFTGNQIGCAAAIASIDLFDQNNILVELEVKVTHIATRLREIGEHPQVGSVRHIGMIIAIELVASRQSKRPYEWTDRVGVKVCDRAREGGVLIRPLGNTIVLMPPLSITITQIDEMLDVTFAAICDVTRDHPNG